MCGICGGVICPNSSQIIDIQQLTLMTHQLVHRGPDRDGFFLSPDHKVGLGFRRLSIIDLTGGNQPISNEDGTIQIVFNGEIYNFQELRSTLERKGHVFSTHSDTETIIHAYEEYGLDFVAHLHGMFAFALWDTTSQKLILARDRLGKKPLFYWYGAYGLYFASELKALLQIPEMPREVDKQALATYLRYQYIPAPHSIVKSVSKLHPASVLVYDARQDRLEITRYWQVDFEPKFNLTMQEAEEALLDTLREAVRQRLISEVPLGALLSGGIDSSLIVALMAEAGPQVKTFTIGFDETRFDERPFARAVARYYGTDHHELVVQPEMMDILPRLVWYLDEPMADPSVLPAYYVSQMARQHVTVALNGDGGDESFGGYWHHTATLRAEKLTRIPGWFQKDLKGALALLFPQNGASSRFSRLREQFDWPLWKLHEARMTLASPDRISSLLLEKSIPFAKNHFEQIYQDAPQLRQVDAMLRADLLAVLPGQLLVKMDRMSMGNSLETRSPLLDHQLVELAARLPTHFKISGRKRKIILRRLATHYLPGTLAHRPKMGFAVPLSRWLYQDYINSVRAILLNPQARIYEFLEAGIVKQLLSCPISAQDANSTLVWALLILETWFQGVLN